MCLLIRNNKESSTLWIATKNIIVYKYLTENLTSPYMDFKYVINKNYKTNIIKPQNGQSFHSYSEFKKYDCFFEIQKGYHAFYNKKTALNRKFQSMCFSILYECTIPKGSYFYIDNIKKEIVSDQIIIKRLIK